MKTLTDYWFTIEPYVFINIANAGVLLYNTLDGVVVESDETEVIELLREMLLRENCGVVLLTHERFERKNIQNFISELREKFMGDIIDVNLSESKPIQILPFFNYPNKLELYKKHSITPYKNILENLSEINIHIDSTSNIINLINFLQSLPDNLVFNIIGSIEDIPDNKGLLLFELSSSSKNIVCSYANITPFNPLFVNNLSYRILVTFPIDMQRWNNSRKILLNQNLPFVYIFDVTSLEDCQQAEQLIEQFQIVKYYFNPTYTGENMDFFKEYVFLSKEDILSTLMSIKDFFANQSINIYDFGKINIMANGDAYANVNYPSLGNIYSDSIYEIVQKELEEGISWFRIRNESPCNTCIYQWICPPPSDYEIKIGRPNLCHIKNGN